MSLAKRPIALIALLACALALALSACGSSSNGSGSTVGTTHAVVGFAAHAGLAFGAFKLFIYDKYKDGKLSLHHPFTLAKAGVAALFAYHEVKTALSELRGHPKLEHLIGPFTALAGALSLLKSHLEHGDTSAVNGVQSQISSAGRQASAAGSPITTATSGLSL